MWIPLIIAILMGLVCPTNNNNSNCNNGTVYVSNSEPDGGDPGDPGDGDGDGEGEEGGEGDDGGETGIGGGPGGTGTGGGTGEIPPPKP